jgi:hypothetical protein
MKQTCLIYAINALLISLNCPAQFQYPDLNKSEAQDEISNKLSNLLYLIMYIRRVICYP